MTHKTISMSILEPDVKRFRAHTLHDHDRGVFYVVHWPRNLQEQLAFESVPGLIHLPHVEDQMTKIPRQAADLIPPEIGVTTEHNTYQALLRLHKHYKWDNLHPHQ